MDIQWSPVTLFTAFLLSFIPKVKRGYFLQTCFVFERARAPRHFHLSEGQSMKEIVNFYCCISRVPRQWPGGMEAIAPLLPPWSTKQRWSFGFFKTGGWGPNYLLFCFKMAAKYFTSNRPPILQFESTANLFKPISCMRTCVNTNTNRVG